MRIGIDARELSNPHTGIGGYVTNLIKSLSVRDFDNEYILFVDNNYKAELVLPENFSYSMIRTFLSKKIVDQIIIPYYIFRNKLDIYHVTHHDVTPLITKTPFIVTVHDLAWIDLKENNSIFNKLYYLMSKYAVKKAKTVITVSKSTMERVLHHFPHTKNIIPIEISCSETYSNTEHKITGILEEFKIKKPFILYVGSFTKRKNLLLLLKALNKVNNTYPNVELVLAGKSSGKNDININALEPNIKVTVIERNKSEDELKMLYKNATMLVFPSFYEGFGLPVLEAMSCGCPVIVGNATSLPEIVGDAGILVDPYDADDLAKQISRVLDSESLREDMKQKGVAQAQKFSWVNVAKATLACYLKSA